MATTIAPTTQHRIFAGLPRTAVQTVLDACEKQTFLAGDVLFQEGDAGDSLWIIESGQVEVFRVIRAGVDRVLATLDDGAVYGEMGFLDGGRRSAGARAMATTHVLSLSRGAFDTIAEQHPSVAASFFAGIASVIADRLRMTNELYKQSVVECIEATGTASFGLHRIVDDARKVTVHCTAGSPVIGRVLGFEHQPAGYALIVKDRDERVSLIPYHAIVRIEV